MNKLKIIICTATVIVATTVTILILYFLSFHQIKFTMDDNISANIYKNINNEKKDVLYNVTNNIIKNIQNGNYCADPIGKNYNTEPICFTIQNSSSTINIDPNYIDEYLAEQLVSQIDKINITITNKYKPLIDNFRIDTGQLYHKGEFYGTTLTELAEGGNNGDVYRLILNNKDNKWDIITKPSIVLDKYNNPNIPINILENVNKLTGSN